MQVNVGSALAFKGKNYLVTRIDRHQVVRYANCSHEEEMAQSTTGVNVTFLKKDIQPFVEGDVIEHDTECVELTEPGRDVQFIYTKYAMRRKDSDGRNEQGVEDGTGKAGDHQAASSGNGDPSR